MIPCTRCKQGKTPGFTLIELLVTIVILGILSALAGPLFARMIATSKIKGAATNLQMSLLRARGQAVKGNASVTVTRSSSNWESGWVVTWNDPEDNPDLGTITLVSEAASPGVTITPANPASITYLRSGRVQNNATVTFTVNASPAFTGGATVKKGRCRTVVLNISGAPTVNTVNCP